MKNLEIASIFGNMADLLEIQGANPFRVRAYRNGRSSLEGLTDTVEEIAKRGALKDISGIGKDLAAKIVEYIDGGHIQAFEDLKKEVPIGLVEIVSVPTIGPKTAKAIFDHFGVAGIADLEKLVQSEELLSCRASRRRHWRMSPGESHSTNDVREPFYSAARFQLPGIFRSCSNRWPSASLMPAASAG